MITQTQIVQALSSSSYKSDYMVKLKTASTSLSKNDYATYYYKSKSDISQG